MKTTERLFDLLIFLVDAARPVPFSELRRWFPDYGEVSEEAALRKFARDKQALLEAGIPLRYEEPGEEDEGGYVVDRRHLFLPELALDADEAAAMALATASLLDSPAFPYPRELRRASEKIALREGDPERPEGVRVQHPPTPPRPELREHLAMLWQALAAHKRVRLTYHGRLRGERTERTVDPYGLVCRRGRWLLVGHCHERDAIRAFSVARIRALSVNESRPDTPDFNVPAGLRVAEHARAPAHRFELHAPIVVELEVREELAFLAERELGRPAEAARAGFSRHRVETTNAEALVEWVLARAGKARIVSPPQLCAELRARAAAVLARYGEEP